jgi:transcriptional regulator CtsR
MHIIKNMGESITSNDVDIFLGNFLSYEIITPKEAKLLKVATSDNVLKIEQNTKDFLRARIFKNMLLNLIED